MRADERGDKVESAAEVVVDDPKGDTGSGDPAHYRHWDFCNGWATQLLREYAELK